MDRGDDGVLDALRTEAAAKDSAWSSDSSELRCGNLALSLVQQRERERERERLVKGGGNPCAHNHNPGERKTSERNLRLEALIVSHYELHKA